MMASTMTIPQVATLPNFHCPVPGPMPGALPPGMQPGYPTQAPVTLQGPVVSGPVVNGQTSPTTTLSPPIQAVRLPVVPVGGGCYNDGMEVVWHGEFSRLFSSFFPPHVWYLSITNAAPQEKWKFYRDSAKVRFCCQDCGNGWTSMKGRVTFWFHLNTQTSEGFVQFKLYGQVCKKCSSGKFEYVMWYPEEVSKVMCNLYNKVGQTFYGFLQPPIRVDRRPGRPRNQHNADLCQACRDGECDQGRPVKAIYNYIPPAGTPRPPNAPLPGRPMFNGAPGHMPVVIRQPPIPHPGHIVMQAPLNTSTQQLPSHPNPSFITAPVTLTSGIQPILTYSIVTAPTKDGQKNECATDEKKGKEAETPKPEEDSLKKDSKDTTTEKPNTKTDEANPDTTTKSPAAKPPVPSAKVETKSDAKETKVIKPSTVTPIPAASLPPAKDQTQKNPTISAPHPTTKTPIGQPTAVKESTVNGEDHKESKMTNGFSSAAAKPLPKVPVKTVNPVPPV